MVRRKSTKKSEAKPKAEAKEKKPKVEAKKEEAPKAETKKSEAKFDKVVVESLNGQVLREYSKKLHGDGFVELAKEFVNKPSNIGAAAKTESGIILELGKISVTDKEGKDKVAKVTLVKDTDQIIVKH